MEFFKRSRLFACAPYSLCPLEITGIALAATVDSKHATSIGHGLKESASSCRDAISFKWPKKFCGPVRSRKSMNVPLQASGLGS